MTQITLNIKDGRKLSFLLELLKNSDFLEVEKTSKISLKDEIKETRLSGENQNLSTSLSMSYSIIAIPV